ncbi:hypothetical protein PhCBS80983_g05374 [Powellomyces hirtus]|uniref:Cyclic nucleotide-binding domain-containing protein n=1 Tax=Powellomyces hirtus TaxID=109895 RepID=A0A507DV70_9FUNG|nr:hypothetical protein PhCBS80983_g05374 [Powellomyces hirtus]
MDTITRRFKKAPPEAADGKVVVKKPSLFPPRNGDTFWEQLTKFYVIPEGRFMRTWDEVMVIITIVNAILVPFMAAFQYHSIGAWIVSYIIDIMYLVDMYIKFHLAYLVGGFWVVFPKEMLMHYLKSWDFTFDCLINFPVDIVAFGWLGKNRAQTKLSLIRLWKILRTGRIIIYFQRQEKKLHASFRIQVMKFVSYAIVLTHGISCIWFANACNGIIEWPMNISGQCAADSWVMMSRDLNIYNLSLGQLYISSLYWAIISMTTLGYGDIRPNNTSERIFSMFTALCGILFYGYINGTIASTLSNMDSRRVAYQQRLDAVKQYMTDRKMDPDMKERVLTYYDYVWERNRGIDVRGLFGDMPATFKQEVALSLNNQIIDNAIIFKECSIGFRRMIAIDMKLFLFTANEYVVHRGDLGLEMYFITQGRIDVYATDDLRRPTASLIEGAYFGEFCVVLGNRHEYSARAVCNTDIYVFAKEDLERAFQAYPDDRLVVHAATQKRYQQQVAARKSRGGGGGGGGTTRGKMGTEIDDLEEEFGTKGSVLKGDLPVHLAGDNSVSIRAIQNVDVAAMGRPATTGGEDPDLEGAGDLGEPTRKISTKRRMSNTGSGYMILDKTMATALSQSSLSPARKAANARSQTNLSVAKRSAVQSTQELSPGEGEPQPQQAASGSQEMQSTPGGAAWGSIASGAAAARQSQVRNNTRGSGPLLDTMPSGDFDAPRSNDPMSDV